MRCVSSLVVVVMASLTFAPMAKAQGISLIRDAETETTIREIATPLFAAAGLVPEVVKITLVNDRSLNAFVAGGQRVFVHTGLLIRVEHAGQLMGVLAHETGHIAGGHLARLPQEYRRAVIASMIESVLAMGAIIASGSNRDSRDPGVRKDNEPRTLGGGSSVAARNFFAFTRAQENAADQAGVAYLDSIGQSSRGFLEFMEILANQELMSANRQDPYMRTHPLGLDRVEFLRNHLSRSRYRDVPVAPDMVARLNRIKAKLIGYLEPPHIVAQRYPEKDQSPTATYARAFAAFRALDFPKATRLLDGLLTQSPDDPYYNEFKGQLLFETGRGREALPYYEKAVKLSGSPLLKIDLAQVRIETGDRAQLQQAQRELQEAAIFERDSSKLWRLAATAYGRTDQLGMAAMASAEQALLEGRRRDARDQARRAIRLLPAGSIGALRAQDIDNQLIKLDEEEDR